MSLKARYIFNNNFQNYGAGDADLTQSTAPTYSANGKVSQYCFQAGLLKWTAAQTAKILNNTAVSIAFWIYPNQDTGTSIGRAIFGNDGQSSLGGRQYTIFQYPKCNDIHFSWQNYDGSSYSGATSGVLSSVLPSREWTHVCIAYQNPNGTIYINGVQKTTFTGNMNTSSYSYETNVIQGSGTERYINDLRIYDHCLSAKEVKELAKGLFMHYRLDNKGVGNLNIAKNPSTYSRKSGNVTLANDKIIIAAKPNQDTYFNIDLSEALVENKEYTLSWHVEGLDSPNQLAWGFPIFAQSNPIGKVIYMKNGNSSITFTCNSTYAGQTVIFMDDVGGRPTTNVGAVTISNIKIEYGNKATPWCPNSTDALYTGLGFNVAVETDCSGFNNNATTIDLAYSSDTPRYSGSTYFNGNTSGLWLPNIFGNVYNVAYTMSFWIKPNGESGSRSIYFGMGDGYYSLNIEKNSGGTMRYYWNGSPDVSISAVTFTDGVWQHIAIVKSSATDVKIYKNGVLVYTMTNNCAALTTHGTKIWIGRDTRTGDTVYKGLMSDFRWYATALSADDVKELYNVAASVDNKKTLHCYQFIEE